MGLLLEGKVLKWSEAKKHVDRIKEAGIAQLLRNCKDKKHLCIDSFVWGDEIECMMVRFDHENKEVKLYSDAYKYIDKLLKMDNLGEGDYHPWKPEYASYMLETTPAKPYEDSLDALMGVEANMIRRRKILESIIDKDYSLITMTGFPRLGCPGFLYPNAEPDPISSPSRSLFIPSEATNPHIRFISMTETIRERKGRKVSSNVPIYQDSNTPKPFIEMVPGPLGVNGSALKSPLLVPITKVEPDALEDCVFVDCMCFGMGCCCLQATFQACSMRQCRVLYDQLTPIAPLMHAITAANPIVRGYLVNTDTRWKIISDVVDDRTDEERGVVPLKENKYRIRKSRYSTVSYYISSGSDPDHGCIDKTKSKPVSDSGGRYYCHDFFKKEYNDVDQTVDKKVYEKLRSENLDEGLSIHYAHIFTRDPIVMYEDAVRNATSEGLNEFENIQSSNWQTLRFKPPPTTLASDPTPIGWRVEFRSMEVQFTDKENAYLVIYANLLARIVLFFNLDLLVPISLTEENMTRAQKFNSIATQKYYFRKIINYPPVNTDPEFFKKYFGDDGKKHSPDLVPDHSTEVVELTLDEIFNGAPSINFVGINNIMRKYLAIRKDTNMLSQEAHDYLLKPIDLVAKRCSLQVPTNATWIRNFVRSHPDYAFDSKVSERIAYDLCKEVSRMGTTNNAILSGLNSA